MTDEYGLPVNVRMFGFERYLPQPYIKLLNDHPFFWQVCAGARHHHWWPGGLSGHVLEMIEWMLRQVDSEPEAWKEISLEDIVVSVFLHDFDKVWLYARITEDDREKSPSRYHPQQVFKTLDSTSSIMDGLSRTLLKLNEYGIRPTDNQWSACLFAHGGYSDANFGYGGLTPAGQNVMKVNRLAVLLHMADMYSSTLRGLSPLLG